MKYINKILFTFASLSYFWTVFFISQNTNIVIMIPFLIKCDWIKENSCLISKLLYLLIPVILSLITILIAHLFNKETIESNVEFVEEISVDFIPTYLGYFFVALSFSDDTKLINVVLVFCILFFFTFVGSKHFFNPLYYVFGYKLYKVKTSDGVESAIYSQQVISSGQSLKECNIHRINKYTYIKYKK